MSREKLSSIKALSFYQDELTKSRRTSPIPQLVCVGGPCKYFQPEGVRCKNIGGQGTDVDWKCEADLPEALRFGKVQVSCEGWSGPGDPFVLKDSCSLEYRLVEVPRNLRNPDSDLPARKDWDVFGTVFTIIWILVLFFILYSFLKSCFEPRNHNASQDNRRPGGSGSGWFPGTFDGGDDNPVDPPPPYTKQPPSGSQNGQGWRPGFWSGLAVGGLADRYLFPRARDAYNARDNRDEWRSARRQYDWERPAAPGFTRPSPRTRAWSSEDRGEGPSNLGATRQSSGFGSSTVR
ncbi:hypothetical protein D9758_003764 [Tetrapyrgos nigripes]|uniref:Store-operated calcium entry-associated regulatory factor n=1 Tax=Tetrapyrgos nigripes TaxID=182062 RepID=A0A8H5LS57_9AGAR|nr:hypothetical protein D9758_003764 [Tetrapyrgos nigripes]